LNGANIANSSSQLTLASTHNFNNILGQIFGETFDTQAVLRDFRAAAGGEPDDHQPAPRPAMGASDGAGYYTGFARAYGNFGAQHTTADAAGFDFGGAGFLFGAGYKFSRELELGATGGFSWNQAELYQHLGKVTDSTTRLGLYGNYVWDDLYFNSRFTFGIHSLTSERYINFMHANTRGDRTGMDINWFNRLGYSFHLPYDFFLTPSYALQVNYFHDPAYTESGGDAALRFDDFDTWSLYQTLELRASKFFAVNEKLALVPEIWGGWEHEYLNPGSGAANWSHLGYSGSSGNKFKLPVHGQTEEVALIGLGITSVIKNKYEVFGHYEHRLRSSGYNAQFLVGFNVSF
jgi:uncharacterized protein with beta-barrel porin domain